MPFKILVHHHGHVIAEDLTERIRTGIGLFQLQLAAEIDFRLRKKAQMFQIVQHALPAVIGIQEITHINILGENGGTFPEIRAEADRFLHLPVDQLVDGCRNHQLEAFLVHADPVVP